MIPQVQGGCRLLKLTAQYLQLERSSMFHFHHDGRDSTKNPAVQVRWMWWYRDLWNQKPHVKWSVSQTHLLDIKTSPPKKNPPKPWLFENSGDNGLTRVACRMKNGGGQSAADRRIAAVVCPSAHETESGASAIGPSVEYGGFNLLPPL